MSLKIKRSILEPDLFEIWEEGQMIEEISVPFSIKKFPDSFPSLEAIKKWVRETEWKLVRMTAYRLIAMRQYPSSTLQKKFQQKRFSREVIDRIIEELKKNGYLKDDEFIENEILREFRRGYGPRYIELKLRSKNLNGEKVRELITNQMQTERIRQLIPKLALRSNRQKIIAALQRRGFDLEIILKEVS